MHTQPVRPQNELSGAPKLYLRRKGARAVSAPQEPAIGGRRVLMSERDMDLLRLLSWCQYIEPRTLSGVCSQGEWENLAGLGLVKLHERSGALVLTAKGTSLLNNVFDGATPQQTQSYHRDAIQRRLRLSRLALTAYHSGVQLFTTQSSELSRSPSLFLSVLTRGRGTNP